MSSLAFGWLVMDEGYVIFMALRCIAEVMNLT